ncbi:protein kinase family protein [Oxalobacter formigenes]|uniref:protein kinase family protein n=1 Tax=Oxalobacter formigenes TaxID=847 RepID=UPI00241EBA63|nr:protein kinase family protein [Oxalobacter formigenes]
MIQPGKIINFKNDKRFTYIRSLGRGGTGGTYLFKDETTNTVFAFKKYEPINEVYRDEYYNRFVDEVKILFNISHQNIVRIYNHYLYPKQKVGYLQMEYIDGVHINEHSPFESVEWNDIFLELINAFDYLEKLNILHRDIRSENILIDVEGKVKIIDFGFGKKLSVSKPVADSIRLNWPVSEYPDEVSENGLYDHKTEIFFIGKLFQNLDLSLGFVPFRYSEIINKMVRKDPNERYSNFGEIIDDVRRDKFNDIKFSVKEKESYMNFADALTSIISKFLNEVKFEKDVGNVLENIHKLLKQNCLENFVQNNHELIKCFISGSFNYFKFPKKCISVNVVESFYKFLISLPDERRLIVLGNLHSRLSRVDIVISASDDDIPF